MGYLYYILQLCHLASISNFGDKIGGLVLRILMKMIFKFYYFSIMVTTRRDAVDDEY